MRETLSNSPTKDSYAAPALVGTSREMAELREEIERIAKSEAKVLITGESGVGKELVARLIHSLSNRAHTSLGTVNCAGLTETLLESELFGHMKGAFTGAYRDKQGKLEMSDGGTIFLDEIGEMTPRMQSMLLRFMETGELQKVGADRPAMRVDVRVVAATNRNLREMVAHGTFREDLYYRLNVIHLVVPPLRERREDVRPLIDYFFRTFSQDYDRPKTVANDTMKLLLAYSWPGNVRELRNIIERLVVGVRGDTISAEHLPMEIQLHNAVGVRPLRERRRSVADDLVKQMLTNGDSFWTLVYPIYMRRDITRSDLRLIVQKGLEEARGSYKIVSRLFNMHDRDYKRFLNFLRKHECQVSFKKYRRMADSGNGAEARTSDEQVQDKNSDAVLQS
jgi:transcriptional regulator with PAS, ATPase and Fis domain